MSDALAIVCYETPFAPCGGIAAVLRYLPTQLREAAARRTVIITPFHHAVPGMQRLRDQVQQVGTVMVTSAGRPLAINVFQYLDAESWYFLLPDDPRVFAGHKHPYDVPAEYGDRGQALRRDALVFGAAMPRVLHLLGRGCRWQVMLHDWQAAASALAFAIHDPEGNHKLSLVLHNSYDSGDLADYELEQAGLAPVASQPASSVLYRVLSRTHGGGRIQRPLFTVSRQFALDLSEDTFQARVMAPHLQTYLQPRANPPGLVGVDNGPFSSLVVPEDVLQPARQGDFTSLAKWKTTEQNRFGHALSQLRQRMQSGAPLDHDPPWGDLNLFLEEFTDTVDVSEKTEGDSSAEATTQPSAGWREPRPWFVMGGRDDPRQKGFDVAAGAAAEYLERGGPGRFLFFPIPGDEGLQGLEFLRELADNSQGRVLVFPFRFTAGFFAAQQGSTFGLMPSLYEPFGAANDFYFNGTLGIGRATGGITEQIVPWTQASSFSGSAARRSEAWHTADAHPTGILYREPDAMPSGVTDWTAINAAGYMQARIHRLAERRKYPLYQAMVDALRRALDDATRLYLTDRNLYFAMLVAGIDHLQQTFSWQRAAREYVEGMRMG